MKCFNNYFHFSVTAGKERDEISKSKILAETLKIVANSSHGYQNMDRGRPTVTNYLSDAKTHGAIKITKFKRLGYINDQLLEIELFKPGTQRTDSSRIFYPAKYAIENSSALFLLFDKYCDAAKNGKLEVDIDSFYLALSKRDVYGCIRPT